MNKFPKEHPIIQRSEKHQRNPKQHFDLKHLRSNANQPTEMSKRNSELQPKDDNHKFKAGFQY